jgi:hypothetical protein
MKPTWLIERGVYGDRAADFIAEVRRQGMRCAEVVYMPGRMPPGDIAGAGMVEENDCVALWGTLPLMQQIQLHHHGWVPGGWCNLETLACSTYYPHFQRFLLNCPYRILSGREAEQGEDELFENFGIDDEIFVRPDSVLKSFPGAAVHRDNFRDHIAAARYDASARIVVSTPKQIGREWRTVVAQDSVLASSQYRNEGAIDIQPRSPPEVIDFVETALAQVAWRPDALFVVDSCDCDGELWILELNSFSCSGFYDCDLEPVIEAASRIAEEAWEQRG